MDILKKFFFKGCQLLNENKKQKYNMYESIHSIQIYSVSTDNLSAVSITCFEW